MPSLKIALFGLAVLSAFGVAFAAIRPPSVPLLVVDPYFSLWSPADKLTDVWPAHWTGLISAMVGMAYIDGHAYRFMGPLLQAGGTLPPAMQQVSLTVHPTTTNYVFRQSGIELRVAFTVASLPDDLELLALPHGFISLEVVSIDGKTHDVKLYFDHTAEHCVHDVRESVMWSSVHTPTMFFTKMGTKDQRILGQKGDYMKINWGYVVMGVQEEAHMSHVFQEAFKARSTFASLGVIPKEDDLAMPRAVNDRWIVSAVSWDMGAVGASPQSTLVLLGYDDIASIDFFGQRQVPYWAHGGRTTILQCMQASMEQWDAIRAKCRAFDRSLEMRLTESGGQEYMELGSLVYRQVMGSCKLTVDQKTGVVRYFMKEISSDGDISTVDVIFPASPFFAYLNPQLLWLQLLPVLEYGRNETTPAFWYNLPWAPHHLGIWPIADIKPKDQENMPVEETANLLLMLALIGTASNHSASFLPERFWPLLCSYADYLLTALPDPGNQLCTDDFMGPSPHNVNLAAKGILGLSAFVKLMGMESGCAQCSAAKTAAFYQSKAELFASYWMANALDRDHYKLQYNLPGSWSLKYNLLFQRLLELDTFPESVFQSETKYYMSKLNQYGVPLDSRATFTKLDWELWVATMSRDPTAFSKVVSAVHRFASALPNRVPLTDWADTPSPKYIGFIARPVVGGFYAKLLDDKFSKK